MGLAGAALVVLMAPWWPDGPITSAAMWVRGFVLPDSEVTVVDSTITTTNTVDRTAEALTTTSRSPLVTVDQGSTGAQSDTETLEVPTSERGTDFVCVGFVDIVSSLFLGDLVESSSEWFEACNFIAIDMVKETAPQGPVEEYCLGLLMGVGYVSYKIDSGLEVEMLANRCLDYPPQVHQMARDELDVRVSRIKFSGQESYIDIIDVGPTVFQMMRFTSLVIAKLDSHPLLSPSLDDGELLAITAWEGFAFCEALSTDDGPDLQAFLNGLALLWIVPMGDAATARDLAVAVAAASTETWCEDETVEHFARQ